MSRSVTLPFVGCCHDMVRLVSCNLCSLRRVSVCAMMIKGIFWGVSIHTHWQSIKARAQLLYSHNDTMSGLKTDVEAQRTGAIRRTNNRDRWPGCTLALLLVHTLLISSCLALLFTGYRFGGSEVSCVSDSVLHHGCTLCRYILPGSIKQCCAPIYFFSFSDILLCSAPTDVRALFELLLRAWRSSRTVRWASH